MTERYSVVITTVNYPTEAVTAIANDCKRLGAEFILVGDQKSPADFVQPGAIYLDLETQRGLGFKYAEIAPAKHYARKNVGYLHAIRSGATVLIETDDDNIPREGFWAPRVPTSPAKLLEGNEWTNVYAYYSDQRIWPRGLPLDRINAKPRPWDDLPTESVYCPIQQGLADENPDVDAIFRLAFPLPQYFVDREPIALRGAWCPFNSQNTTWWKDVFPLLYLPYYCSFRMTDIWRSFVAQRIIFLNGWALQFHKATVYQRRNEHNLLQDFEEEVPGYINNHRIRDALDELDLPKGRENIASAMRMAYTRLIAGKFIGQQELPLLDAWLEDITKLL